MWDIKLKATNEQTKKQDLIDTDNSMVVTKGKGGRGIEKGKVTQIYGGRNNLTLSGGYTMQYEDNIS